MLRIILATASALALAACATGPDYVRPAPPPAASGAFVTTAAAINTMATTNDRWWQLYRDPVLDGLIVDGIEIDRTV